MKVNSVDDLDEGPVLTWGDWQAADKSQPYPRAKLVDEAVLVRLIRESGVRICGHCHQNAKGCAPFVDDIGIAVSMRVWGGTMYAVEHPEEEPQGWNDMGYCQWAWGNPKCDSCGEEKVK